jgi:DNA repair ATPase RecN
MTTRKQMKERAAKYSARLSRNKHYWRRKDMNETLRNVEAIETRIAKLQGQIQDANGELPKLAAKLSEARSIYAAHVAAEQKIRWAELKTELAQHCHELDQHGWNPAGERRITEILATFRMVKFSGQSAEALRHFIEQLKNPNGGRQVRRSWSQLVEWVKLQEVA